jgi:hypothetical protein
MSAASQVRRAAMIVQMHRVSEKMLIIPFRVSERLTGRGRS